MTSSPPRRLDPADAAEAFQRRGRDQGERVAVDFFADIAFDHHRLFRQQQHRLRRCPAPRPAPRAASRCCGQGSAAAHSSPRVMPVTSCIPASKVSTLSPGPTISTARQPMVVATLVPATSPLAVPAGHVPRPPAWRPPDRRQRLVLVSAFVAVWRTRSCPSPVCCEALAVPTCFKSPTSSGETSSRTCAGKVVKIAAVVADRGKGDLSDRYCALRRKQSPGLRSCSRNGRCRRRQGGRPTSARGIVVVSAPIPVAVAGIVVAPDGPIRKPRCDSKAVEIRVQMPRSGRTDRALLAARRHRSHSCHRAHAARLAAMYGSVRNREKSWLFASSTAG